MTRFYYHQKPPGAQRSEPMGSFMVAAPLAPSDPPSVAQPRVAGCDPPFQRPGSSPERLLGIAGNPARIRCQRRCPQQGLLQLAMNELKRERFANALALIDAAPAGAELDNDVLLLRAALLTHSGNLRGAERASAQLLQQDAGNAGAHYLLALCRENAGDLQGALDHDAAAIRLDADFAMPRLHLGLMARRVGDWAGAFNALGEAMPLLKREDPVRVLLFGGGFGRDGLIALCNAELQTAGNRA